MVYPSHVADLVERYRDNRDHYRTPGYKEFRLRKEFVDPFFQSLGWDMANERGYAEAYKDVVHEDSIADGAHKKAPDYAFRVGGTRRFFVETKVPLVHIKEDGAPAYQLRRYGWSAKLPLSILTDFEEFAVYDCRAKPDRKDPASKARLKYIRFDEYEERWEEIESIFSRSAVLKGSFDRYAEDNRRKRGTAEVDEAFLGEIEGWRASLAKNIALRNRGLSVRDLNTAVQRTIDRIVFLRIAEDRGIEPYGRLQALAKGPAVYSRLTAAFRQADERYNSGLFHFRVDQQNAESLDSFTLDLVLDDKVLRDILTRLYYPDSPYEFSVLPADILGQVYEQFLGKVIRLSGRSAVVEEKPEVKKAGGVYYTPSHIVTGVVARCLAPLLQGLTPAQASGTDKRSRRPPIRIIDPACGSGSFLIEAYRFLLDWYREQYVGRGPEQFATGRHPKLFLAKADDWPLTIQEKRRILLTHIFGVDIDAQAVEVTKLSLLLKLLEGESGDALARQMDMFRTRALPDLGDNIKWGNSLISDDLYNFVSSDLFGEEELYRINPFNWETEFREIFTSGGFHAVIGNPPYDVLEKDRRKSSWPHEALIDYVEASGRYQDALGGKKNLFRFFTVKCAALLRAGGRFGMIMPMSLLADTSCRQTRESMIAGADQLNVDCFPQKDNRQRRVFRDAKLSTAIYMYRRGGRAEEVALRIFPWNSLNDPYDSLCVRTSELGLIDREGRPIPFCDQESYDLCLKVYRDPAIVQFSDVEELVIRRGEINQTTCRNFITSNPRHTRLLKGAEIGRFTIYDKMSQSQREWFDERAFRRSGRANPLSGIRRIATQRITGVDDSERIIATIVEPDVYFADSTNSLHVRTGSSYSLEYVLALMSSRLMQWRFRLTSSNNNVGTNELAALPFRVLDFSKPEDREAHKIITRTVKALLKLKDSVGTRAGDQTLQTRQADALEAKLERDIFALYGISAGERGLIEAGAKARRAGEMASRALAVSR